MGRSSDKSLGTIDMSKLQVTSFNKPLAIELPTLVTDQDFIDFCLANRELHIERTAQGKIIVTPPAFADTGASNFKLAVEVGKWADKDGTGIGFDSSSGFTLPNGATRSPDISWIRLECWNALTLNNKSLLHQSVQILLLNYARLATFLKACKRKCKSI